MLRSKFVAARSSRHRTAALALYRALVRTASRVPVPQDLKRPQLAWIVRKRFDKNSSYTSYRLIYAAMTAGYKLLSLLAKAQISDSPEHTQVINHLRQVRHTSEASRATRPPRSAPRRPQVSSSPSEPLLINVAEPGEPPKYTSNILPRPASSFRFGRRVPSLCTTADGQPFLRIKKPQPHALSRMVGRKGKIFSQRIIKIMDLEEESVPQAALEDEWDGLMADLMRRESQSQSQSRKVEKLPAEEANDPEATFAWSVQLSRVWWEYKVETTWEDWVARGDALHNLVEEERALLRQEKAQRAAETQHEGLGVVRDEYLDDDDDDLIRRRPNVGRYSSASMPVLEAYRASKAAEPIGRLEQEEKADPFISESWASIVRSESGRMLKWLKRGASERSADLNAVSWKTNRREAKPQTSPE